MTFLNTAMLLGLVIVAIPIIIHLLNRRKARLVDWGAMRFLLASLAHRNRRIMIEEIILLAVRCLLLALLALALARPFLPSRTTIPWGLVLPAILAAAMLIGSAAAVWNRKKWRWILLGVAGGLIALSAGASAMEYSFQKSNWSSPGGEKDVVIIIDGSMSMSLAVEGKTNFQRAIDEARAVVSACRPADSVSIILGSSRPQVVIGNPTSDRKEIAAALAALSPGNGSMRVPEAMESAIQECLEKGHNPAKKIVIITDGQSVGWDVSNISRWQFLGGMLHGKDFPTAPQVICRTLAMPGSFNNVAVTDIAPARKVIGTDRKVQIDVKIANTGISPMAPAAVELSVDGLPPMTEKVGEIQPNASETVQFEHLFEKPGRHVLTARVVGEDDLPGDNTLWRVVDVIDRLPVLIVDGAPSPLALEGAGEYMQLALNPKVAAGKKVPKSPSPTPPPAGKPQEMDDKLIACLVEPTVVPAADVGTIENLSAYRVVILANVPQLPKKFADDLDQFIRGGGGVFIAAGDRIDVDFYNRWTSQTSERICPVTIDPQRQICAEPVHLDLKSFSHPSLAKLADPGQSNAASTRVRAFWPFKVDAKDAGVRVSANLEGAQPFLAERKLGKGYVLMTPICLDAHDSNLPSLWCFVPMMHQLVYFLAAPTVEDPNVPPGTEVAVNFAVAGKKNAAAGVQAKSDLPGGIDKVEVVTPSGMRRSALVSGSDASQRVTFTQTNEPGLYRFKLTPAMYERLGMPPDTQSGLPFAVTGDSDESRLAVLSGTDLEKIGKNVPIYDARTVDELTSIIAGNVPGEELWKYLAIGALLALICEIALTRWIALTRRSNVVQTVNFGEESFDVQTFRSHAKEILKLGNRQPATGNNDLPAEALAKAGTTGNSK